MRIALFFSTLLAGVSALAACGTSLSSNGAAASSTFSRIAVSVPSGLQGPYDVPGTSSDPLSALPMDYGVVSHGVSVKVDPASAGLTYTCADGEITVDVPWAGSASYGGTVITFTEQDSKLHDPDFSSPNPVGQTNVLITFTGGDLNIIDMIVSTKNGSDVSAAGIDWRVVNLLGAKFDQAAGINLTTPLFTDGYVNGVRLCLGTEV